MILTCEITGNWSLRALGPLRIRLRPRSYELNPSRLQICRLALTENDRAAWRFLRAFPFPSARVLSVRFWPFSLRTFSNPASSFPWNCFRHPVGAGDPGCFRFAAAIRPPPRFFVFVPRTRIRLLPGQDKRRSRKQTSGCSYEILCPRGNQTLRARARITGRPRRFSAAAPNL